MLFRSLKIANFGFVILILSVILYCSQLKKKEQFISINEVIPEAKVLSEADGIIEYKGVRLYLGTDRLSEKKALIESLKLCEFENLQEVDMRFSRQIIIRTRQ